MVTVTVKRLSIHYVIGNECITKNGFECKYTGPKLSVQRAKVDRFMLVSCVKKFC